jgi:hypothetical protein
MRLYFLNVQDICPARACSIGNVTLMNDGDPSHIEKHIRRSWRRSPSQLNDLSGSENDIRG